MSTENHGLSMTEPSKKELRDIFQRAYLARSEQSDPEATYAGYRDLYNAGKADAEARIRAEERERVLARFAELAKLWEEQSAQDKGDGARNYRDGLRNGSDASFYVAAKGLRVAIEQARKA